MPFRVAQEQLFPNSGTPPECIPLMVPKCGKEATPYGHDTPEDSFDEEEACKAKKLCYLYHEAVTLQGMEQETERLAKLMAVTKFFSAKNIDWDAVQFAMRMAVLLTISGLFVLVRSPTWHYPDGMWVLVSVLFVCWFPSLDAASVMEKIIQRLIGTFVGAAFGLGLGFLSLWVFPKRKQQAIFLTCCMFVGNFMIIYIAGQCRVGQDKVIRRFAYATILCVLTFCICMLPFGLDEDPKWHLGVWRICNVIVGCILGAIGSIAVCPRSTSAVLHDKTVRQVKLAGEASEAVLLSAAAALSGRIQVERLAEELLDTLPQSQMRWKFNRSDSSLTTKAYNIGGDVALTKYEDAIADWKVSKALFPLTKYDPFAVTKAPEKSKAFHTEVARTLARTLRMQTTIVVLDGMIRNEGADYEFDQQHFDLFSASGTLIREMLTVPLNVSKSDEAATQLFRNLEFTRKSIVKLSKKVAGVATSPKSVMYKNGMRDFEARLLNRNMNFKSTRMDDDEGLGLPKYATDCDDNALLFLQLVEHLILRSLRLYQAFKHVELDAISLNDESIHPTIERL